MPSEKKSILTQPGNQKQDSDGANSYQPTAQVVRPVRSAIPGTTP